MPRALVALTLRDPLPPARRDNAVMDLRHLRYFVAVAEEGTFAQAAARVRVAQPALSRQVRDLERELDVELFEPGGRAAHLSAGGEAVLRAARSILQEAAV